MGKTLHQIGWTLAAALAAVLFASGFQGTTEKIGVVNITKLVSTSDFGKSSQGDIDKFSAARRELLQFVTENPVITLEQAQKLRPLALKTPRTTDEDAQYTQLKKDISDSTKKLKDLGGKAAPTDDEKALITDLNNRALNMRQTAQGWAQDFQQDVQQYGESQFNLTMDKVQAAVSDVAKAQGFTEVFDTRYAPYGASDLTTAALGAMNANK